MIAYFDTSALVKLLIEEAGSQTADDAWRAADVRMCCTIGRTEVAAAISRAWRMGRIDGETTHGLLTDLAQIWSGVTRIDADDLLCLEAASLAVLFGLRGYDAVHLAAALAPGAMLVAADGQLLAAARAAGLRTVNVGN